LVKNENSILSKVIKVGQTKQEKLIDFIGGVILESAFSNGEERRNSDLELKKIDTRIDSIKSELNRAVLNPLIFTNIKENELEVEKLTQRFKELEDEIARSKSIKELAQIKDKDGFVMAKDVQNINFADRIQLSGALGDFIGLLEKDKCAITLTGKPGSGKTYLCFDIISKFIEQDFSVAYFSIEEGITNLTQQKIEKYNLQKAEKFKINDQATLKDIQIFGNDFDLIVIDSWGKLNADIAEFDKLRIALPRTIFISIFQLTSSGLMRGGTMAAFDAGINIETSIIEAKRVAICTKNRYGNTGIMYCIDERNIL
jgi:DNA replication protein DnaC